MPQLDCSSQPFFLLYLILFSSHFIFCDLQRKKTEKHLGQWFTAILIQHPSGSLMFSCSPAQSRQASSTGGREPPGCGRPCHIVCHFRIIFCNAQSWNLNTFRRVCWSCTSICAHRGIVSVSWEPGSQGEWGLLPLVNGYMPSAPLLQWLMRCFVQCQDSCEQVGRCVGDWRQKWGLWTHWSSAMIFDQKASLVPTCFPCTVLCTHTSTCKIRVSLQFLSCKVRISAQFLSCKMRVSPQFLSS